MLENNSDFQDNNKFINEFHILNKNIKNLFLVILTKLSYTNNDIVEKIQKIFYFSKDSKYIDTLNNYIKENSFILDKIDKIYNQNKSNSNIFNLIKSNFDTNNNINNLEKNKYETEEDEEEDVPKIKPKPPFLPPKSSNDKREYTLVLDLDETLVHFCEDENDEENAYVKVRKYTEEFINSLSEYCEIVIFTASTKYYADIVIDGLKECNDKISGRLYREHTDIINGFNVKDLSKLGRDLSKTIIIDNIEENYQLQPTNGLNIIDFEGEEEDNELEYLKEDLLKLVSQKGLDVRNELNSIRKAMLNRYSNCLK
jgi:Dullard-like phosphatase family protein